MPKIKFPGPCSQCGKVQEYYKKELCDNCYRKAKRRKRGLRPKATKTQLGPCAVCGSTTSSNGRFIRGMCSACYKRVILRAPGYKPRHEPGPRTKYNGPCEGCGISNPSIKYIKNLCPRCYDWRRNTIQLNGTNRRAQQAGALLELTEEQWLRVLRHFDYKCAYCDKDIRDKFTIDHVIPLSKDGTHTIDNVVPCCVSCNSKKGIGPPLRPVITLKE